jgi:hypothetical protein
MMVLKSANDFVEDKPGNQPDSCSHWGDASATLGAKKLTTQTSE